MQKDDRIVGVAGMFNTGTNYLDITMHHNIYGLQHENLWQVPWGKHRMAYVKWNHTAPEMDEYNKTHVLPVVVIRDPYSWMQSMCKSPYAAIWRNKKHVSQDFFTLFPSIGLLIVVRSFSDSTVPI